MCVCTRAFSFKYISFVASCRTFVSTRAGKAYLRVAHARSCNQSLLQSFALQRAVLLLPLGTPFQLQQVLDNLKVSSQGSVDQRALAALIYMIDLAQILGLNKQTATADVSRESHY